MSQDKPTLLAAMDQVASTMLEEEVQAYSEVFLVTARQYAHALIERGVDRENAAYILNGQLAAAMVAAAAMPPPS